MNASLFRSLRFFAFLLMLGFRAAAGPVVVYDTTAGGEYNMVGPIYESPEFIGDKFTVSASGRLNSIKVPLDNTFTFSGPVAAGTVTLWSDNGGVVGTPLFSANVSATNFPDASNTILPPFFVVSAKSSPPVYLTAGTNYWITLSQTTGSGGLTAFSSVNLASAGSVYFDNDGLIQYATGLQPFAVSLSVETAATPTNFITFAATAFIQGQTNTTSGVTTYRTPTRYAVNTKQILKWLAEDEYKKGNYAASNFPASAQLALVGSDIKVLDGNKRVLVDVSDIMTCNFGSHGVFSGRINDRTESFDPSETQLKIVSVTFDDTAVVGGAGVQFNLQGLMRLRFTNTRTRTNTSAEMVSGRMPVAFGEGTLDGQPFVITGSMAMVGF